MDYKFSLPFTVSNVLAVATAILAMRWPTSARVMLGAIFIGASVVNSYFAFTDPQIYIGFGELTGSRLYQSIILGPFSAHAQRYILLIAVCQLFIGVFTCYTGKMMKAAMIGAITFLIAIAPLGLGSAFPSTLIMASAYAILLFKKIDFNIYELVRHKVRYSRQ